MVVNRKKDKIGTNYLDNFGFIDFAELNSFNVIDFENSLRNYLKNNKRRPHGRYKFGEIENEYMRDFSDSFNLYFS